MDWLRLYSPVRSARASRPPWASLRRFAPLSAPRDRRALVIVVWLRRSASRSGGARRRRLRRRHRRAALRAVRVRRPRCGRPARARGGLDRLPRAGARLPRARPGRLVARRSRRHAGDRARGQPGHHHDLRLPATAQGRITTSRAIPSRSSGRATAACSRRARRASTGSSRSQTSRPLRRRSPPARRRRSGPARSSDAAAALARLDVKLTRAHDARTGATLVLVGWLVAFAALGILARRSLAGRAAVLVAPVALGTALVLRAVGRRRARRP